MKFLIKKNDKQAIKAKGKNVTRNEMNLILMTNGDYAIFLTCSDSDNDINVTNISVAYLHENLKV